jgi:hypothetical protein
MEAQPMNTDVYPRIVRVTSLQGFFAEVPACTEPTGHKPVVRLLNRQTEGESSATLLLSLQGLSKAGDVVWLCEAHAIAWLYGKPFGKAAESVHAGMQALETMVRDYLSSHGYNVRPGDYGLPDGIKPLAATFECAKWVRGAEDMWEIRAVRVAETGAGL